LSDIRGLGGRRQTRSGRFSPRHEAHGQQTLTSGPWHPLESFFRAGAPFAGRFCLRGGSLRRHSGTGFLFAAVLRWRRFSHGFVFKRFANAPSRLFLSVAAVSSFLQKRCCAALRPAECPHGLRAFTATDFPFGRLVLRASRKRGPELSPPTATHFSGGITAFGTRPDGGGHSESLSYHFVIFSPFSVAPGVPPFKQPPPSDPLRAC